MSKKRSSICVDSQFCEDEVASPVCYTGDFAEYSGSVMTKTKERRRHKLQLRRIYENPATSDGARVLVDGIWPRGVSKNEANLDMWLRSLAPSKELRQWFNHEPAHWPEFRRRYFGELQANTELAEALETLREQLSRRNVTLLYAAKDTNFNNAVAFKEYLEQHL